VEFSRAPILFIDTTDFPCEEESARSWTGGRGRCIDGPLNFGTQLKKPFTGGLNEFIGQFREPPGVCEIAGAQDADPLFPGPEGEVFRVECL